MSNPSLWRQRAASAPLVSMVTAILAMTAACAMSAPDEAPVAVVTEPIAVSAVTAVDDEDTEPALDFTDDALTCATSDAETIAEPTPEPACNAAPCPGGTTACSKGGFTTCCVDNEQDCKKVSVLGTTRPFCQWKECVAPKKKWCAGTQVSSCCGADKRCATAARGAVGACGDVQPCAANHTTCGEFCCDDAYQSCYSAMFGVVQFCQAKSEASCKQSGRSYCAGDSYSLCCNADQQCINGGTNFPQCIPKK